MRWTTRQADPDEIAYRMEEISWFEFRERWLARAEAESGEVEECQTEVQRVWTLNDSCEGAPCCPNEWVLECSEGELLYVNSWKFLGRRLECSKGELSDVNSWRSLGPREELFPGRALTVRRWPTSHRVAGASASGAALPFTPWLEPVEKAVWTALNHLPRWMRCHELSPEFFESARVDGGLQAGR